MATAVRAREGKRFEYDLRSMGRQDEMTLTGQVPGSQVPVTRTVLFNRPG